MLWHLETQSGCTYIVDAVLRASRWLLRAQVQDLGSGTFGVAKLMKDTATGDKDAPASLWRALYGLLSCIR